MPTVLSLLDFNYDVAWKTNLSLKLMFLGFSTTRKTFFCDRCKYGKVFNTSETARCSEYFEDFEKISKFAFENFSVSQRCGKVSIKWGASVITCKSGWLNIVTPFHLWKERGNKHIKTESLCTVQLVQFTYRTQQCFVFLVT